MKVGTAKSFCGFYISTQLNSTQLNSTQLNSTLYFLNEFPPTIAFFCHIILSAASGPNGNQLYNVVVILQQLNLSNLSVKKKYYISLFCEIWLTSVHSFSLKKRNLLLSARSLLDVAR